MAAKESRKIILLYNRVARALVEFEVRATLAPHAVCANALAPALM